MPLIETRGAGSAQGFGEFAQSAAVNYIEDVFSTYLYTGNGSTQTITNGIDLSGKGGLVWTKSRSNITFHDWEDTVRGAGNSIYSNSTNASDYSASRITAFNSNGYSLGSIEPNANNVTYASWTFRKQAKFFDVVTYTGNGTSQTINHNLGSVPGVIIAKATSGTSQWSVYHRSLGKDAPLFLNLDVAAGSNANYWGASAPTSTTFGLSGPSYDNNQNGKTYVAYLFAHDAGGFGLSGSDNVISCGSYTGNGSSTGPTITLGYEPQWVMVKRSDSATDWLMLDIMRGIPNTPGIAAGSAYLFPNQSFAEDSAFAPFAALSATGFSLLTSNAQLNASGGTYIYIAIRRGPMKVPTSGTSVFSPNAFTTNNVKQTTGFPVDMLMGGYREAGSNWAATVSRLQGLNTTTTSGSPYPRLITSSTGAELSGTNVYYGYDNTGFISGGLTGSADNIAWSFRRAPGFFDVVCYTGDGTTNRAITHNLTVIPELIINKPRSYADFWEVYQKDLGVNSYIYLNSTNANGTSTGNWSSMTASAFGAGYAFAHNRSSETYVAYLFATLAGVSKVGSYTGTGTTKQIDCGFTGGARFVLIKRTDSTGDWYVYDSARGIVAGNDPYLLLNSTAAEVTNTDYVDTYSAGFELSSTAPAALNANGGSFIFFAVA